MATTTGTLETTLGAIILGVPLATMFSGILIVECIMYWSILDMVHSSVLMVSSWKWFITDHGTNVNFIPITIAISVLTASLHNPYHRIRAGNINIDCAKHVFMENFSVYIPVSKQKYWLTVPIIVLAGLRFVLGCLSSSYMLQLKNFEAFRHSNGSIILRRSRAQSVSLDGVIDSLILYSFETGLATVISTLAMLITWIVMRENLIFLALHFIVAKLYANSIVAMLNYRPSLRERAGNVTSRSIDAVDLDVLRLKRHTSGQRGGRFNYFGSTRDQLHASSDDNVAPVEVNVTKTMQMHVDEILTDEPACNGNSKAMPMGLMDTESAHSQY
ncbi:hypothetical protein BT96DRAFT_946873 [Gymnopus androsaceus JB14]|uniref:DUF6534 domain-containing protein n=1 Tax=Gymnopus androsaceus JB14 TaxID=1447944 RepID=A0A6A4GUK2_9AGAR|nr:hypothetical protein BT96DRAFT_946873 [Gymnopus androsaceus JB14]